MLTYNGNVYTTLYADDEATPGIDLLPKFYTQALVDLGEEFDIKIPMCLKS